MSYVVAGVSGNTGRVVASSLLDRKQPVRVVVRSEEKGKAWKERGAEVAVADLADPAALARALTGARGAYLLVPPSAGASDFPAYQDGVTAALVKATATAAVPHVVLLSSIGAQHPDGTGPIAGLHRAERAFAELRGTRLSSIRAGFFMENFATSLGSLGEGVLPSFLPADLAHAMIATDDIGATATELLLDAPAASRVVELGGPPRSARDAARALTAILGTPIEVAEAPFEAVVPALTGFGLSPSVARGYEELFRGIASGRVAFEGGHRRVEGTTSLETVLARLVKG